MDYSYVQALALCMICTVLACIGVLFGIALKRVESILLRMVNITPEVREPMPEELETEYKDERNAEFEERIKQLSIDLEMYEKELQSTKADELHPLVKNIPHHNAKERHVIEVAE